MLKLLKRLLAPPAPRPSAVHPDAGAPLVGHDALPVDLHAEDAMAAPVQVDGDPAPGRPVAAASDATALRDAFLVPGGLGLPAVALVNLRDPRARVELWALDSERPGAGSAFARRLALALPPGHAPAGWQVSQVAPLPRLQALVALRRDGEPRTALVAVLDLASGRLRELGVAEPDPFADGPRHVAALRAGADAVLVRWHRGRVPLGRWGDVALEDDVLLFTPRERDGLPLLRLALDDGNIRGWAMRGTTLWLRAIDGRLQPAPRQWHWSLDLSRLL